MKAAAVAKKMIDLMSSSTNGSLLPASKKGFGAQVTLSETHDAASHRKKYLRKIAALKRRLVID